MNDKKYTTLSGRLMFPLCVGCRALIWHNGSYIHTSRVEAIHCVDSNAICFETRNTHYRLLPATISQTAEFHPALSMAA